MKIVYQEGNRKSVAETTWEAREAVEEAIALVSGKVGFRTCHETWRNCQLIIRMGHNIYTTSIEIRPLEKDILNRRNWHNGYAYFCNGMFWANFSRSKIELI